MSRYKLTSRSSGFTLIELLVVIAIIAILAAILFPVFAQAREKARAITCESNIRQISLGMLQYVQDYDETYPLDFFWNYNASYDSQSYLWSSSRCVQPYLKSDNVYQCPDDQFNKSGFPDIYAAGYPTNPPLASLSYMANAFIPTYSGPLYGVNNPRGIFVASQYYEYPIYSTDGPTTLGQVKAPASVVMFIDGRQPGLAWAGSKSAGTDCDRWNNNELDWCAFGGVPGDVMWPYQLIDFIDTTGGPLYQVWHKHQGKTTVAFSDGHVKMMNPSDLDNAQSWIVNAPGE